MSGSQKLWFIPVKHIIDVSVFKYCKLLFNSFVNQRRSFDPLIFYNVYKSVMLLFLLQSFVSGFLVVALERLRQSHVEAGDKRAVGVTFCGIMHQLIAVAIVLPCIRTIFRYSHHHPLLPMYSYVSTEQIRFLQMLTRVILPMSHVASFSMLDARLNGSFLIDLQNGFLVVKPTDFRCSQWFRNCCC